jgi:PAS domain S-box-containing protein
VAWGLFLIFWNTRKIIENKSLILLGIAYLFVGTVDLLHTLSYKGMGVLGPETAANPAFFSLFGYTADDPGQLQTQDLYVNPENRAGFIKELNKSGFVKDYLEQLQTRDGCEMDCLVTTTVRRSGDGDILGYQGTIRDISEVRRRELEKEQLIFDLQDALAEVKKLSGLLPICMHCKKIRDDTGYWNQLESYIQKHSYAEFSHSICKDCAGKYYSDMDLYDD